jgi:hypothetical protein
MPGGSTKDTRAFEAAVQALLAPVARYARTQGIGPDRFARIVARAARGDLPKLEPELPYEVAVRLVGRWSSDRNFLSRGKPKPLPLEGPRSFASLVRAARAGSVDRAHHGLVQAGLVTADRQGRLRLRQRVYVPSGGKHEKIDILGRAAAEFLRVLTHNLSSPVDESLLQRVASYDNIGRSSLMMLRRALRQEGLRALERANALLAGRDRDRNPRAPGGRRTRVSFGVYVLEEPVADKVRRGRARR